MDLSNSYDIALLLVRVGLGVTLALHGYNKFFGGGKIPGTAGWFGSIGMRPGRLHAVLAASTEMGAGLLFAFGLLTSFAAAGFVGLMVVAALLVHRKSGFFIVSGGWEYTFILGFVPVCVAAIGPGELSVDHLIKLGTDELPLHAYFDSYWGFIISAGGGVLAALLLLAIFYRPEKSPADNNS